MPRDTDTDKPETATPTAAETAEEWSARIKARAVSLARANADSIAGGRLVRMSIDGKLTRRELFVESFAVGYQFGIVAGMDAGGSEVERLAALLECARVVTRADECALDCDEASPCIYCRSAARLDAHFDRGAGS